MRDILLYPAGTSDAVRFAVEKLLNLGIPLVDHPTPEATHLLLDTPCQTDPRELLERLPEDITVVGGNLSNLHGWKTFDLLKDESYLAKNAAITAECALRIAGAHMTLTFRDAPVLILGWGRIGKHLAYLLKGMGCPITVAARKTADRAMLNALGYEALDPNAITGFDRYRVVFNTAPGLLLNHVSHESPSGCAMIELASVPGLVGSGVVQARGLPGKLAAESSGNLIADTIITYIREETA